MLFQGYPKRKAPKRHRLAYSYQMLDSVSSGLYYKHMTIVNDDSSIVSEQRFLLIDDARGVIYDCRMFIIQATDLSMDKHSSLFPGGKKRVRVKQRICSPFL